MLEQIKASAGSGKTYTLTQRFLLLLSEMSRQPEDYDFCPACRPPQAGAATIRRGLFSEILAMTFTNKAAAEMKSRIIEALKKCVLAPAGGSGEAGIFSPSEARAWLDVILRRYDALNIRTIDSLLAMLTRISAGKLGIPPDFEISFDDAAYLDPLYDELLDRAAEGEAEIAELLEKSALALSLSRQSRGFTVRDLRAHVLGALQTIQEQCASGRSSLPTSLPCTDEGKLYARLGEAARKLNQSAEVMAAMLEKYGLNPLENFRALLQSYQSYAPDGDLPNYSRYLDKSGLEECLRKKDQAAVCPPLQAAFQDFLTVLKRERGRVQFYKSARKIMPVTKLACLLLPGLDKLRSASGILTGSMLPALAREALGGQDGVSEACCRLGSRLTHLLIDEFQDTSRAQWQAIEPLALECLSRGGSLRYVGDVKQAIYSWRGGDSSLFDEIAQLPELRAVNPHPQFTSLQFNWRSAPQLVKFNNRFFARLEEPEVARSLADILLPKAPPAVLDRAAASLARAFSGTAQTLPGQPGRPKGQVEPGRPKGQVEAAQGFVGIQKVEGERLEDFKEELKLKFKALLADNVLLRRPPGEVAVLVRSGAEAEDVAAWLGELGVEAVTEHSFKLADNPLIQRLVSFLRFVDYPADDLNFWNFISGPECFCRVAGLAPAELDTWLAGLRLEQLRGSTAFGPLYVFFRRDFPEFWESLLAPFYNQSGLMSAYDLVSELYNRYALTELLPEQDLYLRCFLELLYNAGRQGQASPAAFLDFWQEKGREEKVPRPETPDSVSIMTLHKAKGLEFPVVILPYHRFSESNARDLTVCPFEGEFWLVEENESLGEAFYAAKSSAALEKLHLLYVGWTRAAEEMHLFVGGSELDRRRGMPRALEFLLDGYDFNEDGYFSTGSLPNSTAVESANLAEKEAGVPALAELKALPETSRRPGLAEAGQAGNLAENKPELPTDWRPMDWLPRLKIFRNPVPEAVYDERARGSLFHNCLENLSSLANLANQEDRLANIEQAVQRALHGFPLPLDNLDQARREAVETLQWFCALPGAADWLSRGRREQSIVDENGQLHRMDLLFQDGENLLALEYKSGRARPEHLEQIRRYLELLARGKPTPLEEPRGLLVYLDERRLQEVRLEPAGLEVAP